MLSDDDDILPVSAETLCSLYEFHSERSVDETDSADIDNREIEEEFQLSQFWYDEKTADVLAAEALRVAGDSGTVACVSCPTLYKKIRKIKPRTCMVKLFEYDQRFSIYRKDFIFYDYHFPLDIPAEFEKRFDIVFVDPPFLSEECIISFSKSVNFLVKENIVLCTGSQVQDLAAKLMGVKPCQFQPCHINKLALQNLNFRCFANYNIDDSIMQ